MSLSAAPLLELAGLGKAIPGGGLALRDASCRIGRGESVAVVGVSGSGKTTLLSLLGLLDRASGGAYRFDGTDVAGLDEAARNALRGERIGFVFQNSYLMADESVADNVSLPLRVRGVDARTRRARVDAALARVDLDGFQGKRAGELSGGEKQRVAVARALVGGPDVILADEPTGALDVASSIRLVELLRDINARGTTVVVVTHDPLVAAGATRRIELVDGVTREAGQDGTWPRQAEPAAGGNGPARARRLVPQESGAPSAPGSVVLPASSPPPPPPDGAEAGGDGAGAGSRDGLDQRPRGTRAVRWAQEVASAALAPLGRPIRSGLVLLAYVLGVAALVGAIGLAQSATGQIVNRLTEAASNQVMVTMASEYDSPFLLDPSLPDGAAARASRLDGVTLAVPVRTYGGQSNAITRVPRAGASGFLGRIYVTEASYLASYGYRAAQGAYDRLTSPWVGPTAAVGSEAARTLGVPEPGPGVQLWVNGHPVDVIAVLAPTGDVLVDGAVFFSRGADPFLVNVVDSYLLVRTGRGYAEPLAKALPLALAPSNPGAVTVSVTSQLANLQAGVTSDLSGLLGVLAWVILALSALSAGTTMFLSVQHRAPEIALRRAMGASRASIWRIFTYEGLLIGLAGGAFGSAAGVGLVGIVARHNGWPVCLGLTVALLGLAAGLVTGALASAVPALYAARRDPAQILRTV